MTARTLRNLAFALLIPAGAAFVVTAFAYGLLAFGTVNFSRGSEAGQQFNHPLFHWLRGHGDAAILAELAVLAALTVVALATDGRADAVTGRGADPDHSSGSP